MPANSYTEFCCRNGGNNLNAGTVDGGSTEPAVTPLVTYTAGDWNSTTDIYTAPVGADMTEAVVGRFASVYVDGDTVPTTNQYLTGRISVVNAGTRQITLTAIRTLGTEVTTGTGNRSMRIGGAWNGPNGAVPWFDNFPGQTSTNADNNPPRVNLKNDKTYSVTANIPISVGDCAVFAGYSSTYGDGGIATIDGGTSGASYILFSVSGTASPALLQDIEFKNNGATGSANGVSISAPSCVIWRCVFRGMVGAGYNLAGGGTVLVECEAYGNNTSNTAATPGIGATAISNFIALTRCISHDNITSNSPGFRILASSIVNSCIGYNNGSYGYTGSVSSRPHIISNCDFYNNGAAASPGNGGGITSVGSGVVENSNFLKNEDYGVNTMSASFLPIYANNGFGKGSMANQTGDLLNNSGGYILLNSVDYTPNTAPWNDVDTGNFTITNSEAKGRGRGKYTQEQPGQSGTEAFPDIGAAQSSSASGGGGGGDGGGIRTGLGLTV